MRFQGSRAGDEPLFEPPPRVTVPRERRLTAQVATRAAAGAAHDFRDNAVAIEGFAAVAVGRAVAATFALAPGPLDGPPDSLAAVLAASAAGADAVAMFEAAVVAPGTGCLLLRGIVLPTHTGVEAVLSWKQVLDADAAARLRVELLAALRPVRRGVRDAFPPAHGR